MVVLTHPPPICSSSQPIPSMIQTNLWNCQIIISQPIVSSFITKSPWKSPKFPQKRVENTGSCTSCSNCRVALSKFSGSAAVSDTVLGLKRTALRLGASWARVWDPILVSDYFIIYAVQGVLPIKQTIYIYMCVIMCVLIFFTFLFSYLFIYV